MTMKLLILKLSILFLATGLHAITLNIDYVPPRSLQATQIRQQCLQLKAALDACGSRFGTATSDYSACIKDANQNNPVTLQSVRVAGPQDQALVVGPGSALPAACSRILP